MRLVSNSNKMPRSSRQARTLPQSSPRPSGPEDQRRQTTRVQSSISGPFVEPVTICLNVKDFHFDPTPFETEPSLRERPPHYTLRDRPMNSTLSLMRLGYTVPK